MPRFALLRHDTPFEHFDLMLEPPGPIGPEGDDERALATWRLPPTIPAVGDEVEATPLPPHRRAYLWYEGPTRSGAGSVSRVDDGSYESVEDEAEATFRSDRPFTAKLRGAILRCRVTIEPPREGRPGVARFTPLDRPVRPRTGP